MSAAAALNCRESASSTTPGSRGVREDYDKVNELLAGAEAEIRRSFLNEVENAVDDTIEPVVHFVSSWGIAEARDFAWINVRTLWVLRRAGPLPDGHITTLAHAVGMGSRLLLTSVI